MENQKLIWNTSKPTHHGSFICDIGAKGVIYGWYDGEKWYKWGTNYSEQDRIYIYGWIDWPIYIETKSSQIKKQ